MLRSTLLAGLVVLGVGCSVSGPAYVKVQGPGGSYDVKEFGAVGDGKALDTGAINRAIAAAAGHGGGVVQVPAGDYLCHSIHLRSNITLCLGPGATIVAAEADGRTAGEMYDAPEPNPADPWEDFGHSHWHNSLIWGEDLHDVAIVGPGRIWGRGLSKGDRYQVDSTSRPAGGGGGAGGRGEPLHDERDTLIPTPGRPTSRPANRSNYPNPRDTLRDGVGNKSIALKNCRNVIFRDFSILHGGHFAILATGVDNFTVDHLRLDTNRDGMDIDCCRDVHISNCSVNSPWDDGICLKSCYGLGKLKGCDDVTITGCYVTGGLHEGTLLDGTFVRFAPTERVGRTGRIKFGTESNGSFKRIAIANCVMDYCGGLAIESVDGAIIEDVTISNITMHDIVNAPIFIRLGARLRGPNHPPVGAIRRVSISNITCYNANWRYPSLIAGLPGHPIQDLSLSNLRIIGQGGGAEAEAALEPRELEDAYPEPTMFGTLPASAMYVRHAAGLSVDHAAFSTLVPDVRPAFWLEDVAGVDFDHVSSGGAVERALSLKGVTGLSAHNSFGQGDMREPTPGDRRP